MALLLAILAARGRVPDALGDTTDAILRNMSLLFVPAGVGIVQQYGLIAANGLKLAIVLVVSTIIAMVVTGHVFQALGAPHRAAPAARGARPGGRRVITVVDLWIYLSGGPLLWLTATLVGLRRRRPHLARARPPSPRPPGAAGDRHRLGALGADRHLVPDLFRRGAVRPFPARPGHGGAGGAALSAMADRAPLDRADGGGAAGGVRGGDRLGGGARACCSACRTRWRWPWRRNR